MKIIETYEQWPSGVRFCGLRFKSSNQELKRIIQITNEAGDLRSPTISNGLYGDDLQTIELEYLLTGRALKIARKWALDVGKRLAEL